MSLNKFKDSQLGQDLGLEIGCKVMNCDVMNCSQITMTPDADIDAHNVSVAGTLSVDGIFLIGDNNYATPDLGQPNYSLHTDGLGNTFWSPDDTGSNDITYSGTPPTIVGQLCIFDNTAGGLVKQSEIIADGSSLNLAGQNITNADVIGCNQLDTVDISITGALNASTIGESILNTGVSVDGVLLKDGLVNGVDVSALSTTVSDNTTDIGTNSTNISDNTTDIGTNATNIGINATNIGINATDIGTNATNIGINATNIGTNTTNIGTNSTNIGNLSSSKLDKSGTANLAITSAMPVIFLNDNVSVGGCNGVICLKDSTAATIAEMSAPSGYFQLKSKANVPGVVSANLRLQNDINGTPTVNSGGSLVWSQEVRPDTYFDACSIASKLSSVLIGAETSSMIFKTLNNGTPTDMLVLNALGLNLASGLLTTPSTSTNIISEYFGNSGVTIDGVLCKDSLVNGVDISALSTTVSNLGINKLDKIGTSSCQITSNDPSITLKDAIIPNTCRGSLKFLDVNDKILTYLSAPDSYMTVVRDSTVLASIQTALVLRSEITGTPAVGCGGELLFEQEVRPSVLKGVCGIASLMANVSGGSEYAHMIFKTMISGINTERMRLSDNLTLYSGAMQSPVHLCNTLDKYDLAGSLLIGSAINTSAVDLSRPNTNTNIKGNLVVDQDFTYTREFFNIWTTNGTSTTPVLIGQLTKMLFGVSEIQTGFLNGFSFGGVDQITYNGSRTKKLHLSCTMTISVSERDPNLQIFLRKNGTTLIPSIIADLRIIDKDWHLSTSFSGVEIFSTGDYIEFFCIYGKNANVFIHNLNLTGQALPNP